jgi:hypothetical protein
MSRSRRQRVRAGLGGCGLVASGVLLGAMMLSAPGCRALGTDEIANFFTSTSSLTTRSINTGVYIAPEYPVAVFVETDDFTADVYLTDIPLSRLADDADTLSDVRGTIVHIHVFLVPWAGRTPVADSAVNCTVREIVVSGGEMGLYSGGGFIMTSEPDGAQYSADVRQADLRLAAASAGFVDKLGASLMEGGFTSTSDVKASRILAGRMASIAARLSPVNVQGFDLPQTGIERRFRPGEKAPEKKPTPEKK